jgi:hypothetical protein
MPVLPAERGQRFAGRGSVASAGGEHDAPAGRHEPAALAVCVHVRIISLGYTRPAKVNAASSGARLPRTAPATWTPRRPTSGGGGYWPCASFCGLALIPPATETPDRSAPQSRPRPAVHFPQLPHPCGGGETQMARGGKSRPVVFLAAGWVCLASATLNWWNMVGVGVTFWLRARWP